MLKLSSYRKWGPKHKGIEKLIWTLANDENWIVREYAAGTFGRMLAKDFPRFSTLYLKWGKKSKTNVKRAVALAVKYGSRVPQPSKWKTYLKIISPLMSENEEYVKKNLGPFSIGDGLLSKFPDQVLNECTKWAKSKNPVTRWNTVNIFSAAAARNSSKTG